MAPESSCVWGVIIRALWGLMMTWRRRCDSEIFTPKLRRIDLQQVRAQALIQKDLLGGFPRAFPRNWPPPRGPPESQRPRSFVSRRSRALQGLARRASGGPLE
eukprot:3329024-Pyramimonas_sp.AAC.1